jgi:hypothetical protein
VDARTEPHPPGTPPSGALTVPDAPTSELAAFIAAHPGLAEALLADHVDDDHGYCRACALGAQRGYHRWPCTIAAEAEASGPGRSA